MINSTFLLWSYICFRQPLTMESYFSYSLCICLLLSAAIFLLLQCFHIKLPALMGFGLGYLFHSSFIRFRTGCKPLLIRCSCKQPNAVECCYFYPNNLALIFVFYAERNTKKSKLYYSEPLGVKHSSQCLFRANNQHYILQQDI